METSLSYLGILVPFRGHGLAAEQSETLTVLAAARWPHGHRYDGAGGPETEGDGRVHVATRNKADQHRPFRLAGILPPAP